MVPDPRQWLEEAQTFLRKLSEIQLEKRMSEKCVKGLLPDYWTRRAAQSSVEEKFAELDSVIERGKDIQKASAVRGFKQLSEVDVMGKNRIDVMDEIWKLVSSPVEAGSICIHGTAGVGKTVVAIAIHNKALEKVGSLFDYVIWVTLRYDANVWEAQEDIASHMKIKLPNTDSTHERALVLKNTLLQMERFLIVLDSVWRAFSIEDLGIPELVDGRKLIVTSRISTVCSKTKRGKSKELPPLSRVDAWELFDKEVAFYSKNLLSLDDSEKRTKDAVEELNGLPWAIKLLARTMSEIHEDDPDSLKGSWSKELDALDISMVSSSYFGYSYDKLKVEAQHCLLFCALFPKDYLIENKVLIEHWMWEGLLGNIETLEKSRNRGQYILKELKDAHLLEGGGGSDRKKVKMLNLVRHMAISTMVKAVPEVFIRSGDPTTSIPTSHVWLPEVKTTSFIQNHLKSLVMRDYEPNYNRLSTLLLQDNPSDDTFFCEMRGLRVLDLSGTMISMLPPSLSYLTSLRALLLRGCKNMTKLPDLSKLQELIVLSLSGTPLDHCPEGLHNMLKLRSLDLTQTRIKTFPPNVVGKLIKLEELLLCTDHENGGYLWRSKKLHKYWNGACVEELVGSKKLAVLELNFLDTSVFNLYVDRAEANTRVPTKFHFYVGDLQNVSQVEDNSVTVSGSPPCATLPSGISELRLTLSSAEINVLPLRGCLRNLSVLDASHLTRLTYLLTVEILGSLRKLTTLRVTSCKAMVGIVRPDVLDSPAKVVHHELKTVVFFDLPNLQSVCRGQVLDCPSLVSLHVWGCTNLKMPMILHTNSKKIEIRCDNSWTENLTWDNPNNANPFFSQHEKPNTSDTDSYLKFVRAPVPAALKATATRYVRIISLST
ncbi:hypothetical protein V2J09_002810 [Rumex salicifolius]